MVSTLTEVTSQFLSAAVSRTFCSTDRPDGERENGGGVGGEEEAIQTDGSAQKSMTERSAPEEPGFDEPAGSINNLRVNLIV